MDYRLESPAAIAEALRLKRELGLAGRRGGQPDPDQFAMPKADIDAAIAQALREADEQGEGQGVHPFLLAPGVRLTGGNSQRPISSWC